MKNIKNNFLGFIIGGIVFGGISYGVASQILATQVSYTNEKSEANVTSVDGALTELYGLAEQCQSSSGSGSAVEYKGSTVETIYLDPTNLNKTCSSADSSDTGTNNVCMKFYVYAEDGEYKYAILDHNTTAGGLNFYEAQSQVKEDTKEWNPNLQARNIRADEVYKITESTNNCTNWQVNGGGFVVFNGKNGSNGIGYGWLFDRIGGCTSSGCTNNDGNVYGYWTSDARSSSSKWYIYNLGAMRDDSGSLIYCGVRPVIQIAK